MQSNRDDIARLHFKTGTAHFDAGEYERAAEEFRQAYALSPRAELLYNLSQAYERLAQLGPAIEAMEGYLERSDRITPEDRSRLEVRLANMRKRQAQQAEAVAPKNVAAAGAQPVQPAPAKPTQAAAESDGSILTEPWLWVAVGVAAGVVLGVVLLPGDGAAQPEPLRTDNALPNVELRAGGMR